MIETGGFTTFYNQKLEVQSVDDFWKQQNRKIALAKNNVSLQFYFASATNLGYKSSFIVHINTPAIGQIRASQIDMDSLKQAIWDNVDDYDKQYTELRFFSTNKAEFYFDWKKWINNAFKDIELKKEFSIFNRRLMFKIRLPQMIRFDSIRNGFCDFIERKMREKITADRLEKKKFIPFLPKKLIEALDKKVENLFDYTYDMTGNMLIIKLKPQIVLIASLILATTAGAIVANKKFNKGAFFDASFKDKLGSQSKEWVKLIDKKFLD